MKKNLIILLCLLCCNSVSAEIVWFDGTHPVTYQVDGKVDAVVQMALRLRANTLWPAMHEGTPAFFTVEGNKEMADSFGIVIGTSHCEPLLRNNVTEWDHASRGPYNYITNRRQVQNYWAERLKEVCGTEALFTIGMRGIHDGSMEGVSTKEEKLRGLQQVIDDQRQLIRKYYNNKVERVPQVFIPYKEVLEIMESGLRVPDDVTLMWCGDLRCVVSIDDIEFHQADTISLKTPYRSERWKQSILRCQSLNMTTVRLTKGAHKLYVKALDEHIIFDQWMVDFCLDAPFYTIPVERNNPQI